MRFMARRTRLGPHGACRNTNGPRCPWQEKQPLGRVRHLHVSVPHNACGFGNSCTTSPFGKRCLSVLNDARHWCGNWALLVHAAASELQSESLGPSYVPYGMMCKHADPHAVLDRTTCSSNSCGRTAHLVHGRRLHLRGFKISSAEFVSACFFRTVVASQARSCKLHFVVVNL